MNAHFRNFRTIRNLTVQADPREEVKCYPLQVIVSNNNFEDAFRKFKTLVQSEGVINTFKESQAYEKPSIKKRRKQREAEERRLMQAAREAQILSGEWDKRQKAKEARRIERADERKKQQAQSEGS